MLPFPSLTPAPALSPFPTLPFPPDANRPCAPVATVPVPGLEAGAARRRAASQAGAQSRCVFY